MSLLNNSMIQTLMWPGMQLMRRLRFPAKIVLMSVVLLVPLAWLTVTSLRNAHDSLEATRREASASPLLGQALAVMASTQTHRGLVNRALAGDASATAALEAHRLTMKASISTLQRSIEEQPWLGLQSQWQPIAQVLGQLAGGQVPAQAPAAFALHSAQVEALRGLIGRVAEASGLLLDPDAGPFHLQHLAVEPLPVWTEALGQLRGRGAALLKKGEATPAERADLLAHTRMLDLALGNAEAGVGALQRAGEAVPPGFAPALAAARAYAELVQRSFGGEAPSGDAAAYFEAGSAAIAQTMTLGRAATDRMQQLLDERAEALRLHWYLALASGLGTLLVVGYLSMAFFRTSFGAVQALQGSVGQLAAGNFAARVQLRGTDELSVVGQSLDQMTGRLSEMVADIRSNATMVAQAGMQLATDTKALSERTEQQAASLEQTNASVAELSSTVDGNAQGADQASALAAEVRQVAEAGGGAIHQAVTAMRDIQSSSQRVQEIVGVIEGLSFQTNLLALNAAVEAARAGEQGRGFAVVAAEVRSLAQRSAESAREIKGLIAASAEHVNNGVASMDGASQTFGRIVDGIREVAEQVHAIKLSSAEQSGGLTQIVQAVRHIDEITQRNAQMVEGAFHRSSQLSERAERLSSAVANFKLRQGSADEALALVRRAVALHQQQGGAALAQITREGETFADRDMYVFAFDRQGIYRAFAGKPEKVGTSVRDVPGVDGDKLVHDAFEQAGRGGGWVDYQFANPQTGATDLKTSYVEPAGEGLLLGCGIYKSRGQAKGTAAGAATAATTAPAVLRQGARTGVAAPKHTARA